MSVPTSGKGHVPLPENMKSIEPWSEKISEAADYYRRNELLTISLCFRSNPPIKKPVGFVVPYRHDHNGHQVCDVAVHVQHVEFHV
jgi:hypothetical protein